MPPGKHNNYRHTPSEALVVVAKQLADEFELAADWNDDDYERSPEALERWEDDISALNAIIREQLADAKTRIQRWAANTDQARRLDLRKEVLARSIRECRVRCETTQEELAQAMRKLGFSTWKRITVAEVESGKRMLSIEEALGMAVLFGTDLRGLLTAVRPYEVIQLNESKVLTRDELRQVVTEFAAPDELRIGSNLATERIADVKLEGPDAVDNEWRPVGRYHEAQRRSGSFE